MKLVLEMFVTEAGKYNLVVKCQTENVLALTHEGGAAFTIDPIMALMKPVIIDFADVVAVASDECILRIMKPMDDMIAENAAVNDETVVEAVVENPVIEAAVTDIEAANA